MNHRKARPSAQAAGSQAKQPDQLVQRALVSHRQGDAQLARDLYETALQADPEHFDALHLLGILEYQAGHAQRAIALLTRALRVNPAMAAPHSNLGLAHQALGRYEDARHSFERALAIETEHVETLNNLGNVLRDMQQPEAALARYDAALRIKPDYLRALNNRGNVLRDLQRHGDAIASLDAALRLDPQYAEAHYNRGNALQDLHQHEAAAHSYRQALHIKPDMIEASINLGNALQDLAQYGAALSSYEHALRLAPNSIAARLNHAHTLQRLHEPEAALLSYELALNLQPDHVDALIGRGDVLRDLNRYQEALACAEQALQLRPDHAPAFNSRGVTLGTLGRFSEAQADHRRTIELAPNKGLYYRNLVQAGPLAADDKHFEAMRQLAQAPDRLAPDDRANLHFALGDALEKLGLHDDSFAQYLQANALQRQRTAYPERTTLGLMEWCRTTFTSEFLQRRQGLRTQSDAPIFVIGMPRSGSTLIEHILDSHPAMYGCGERRDFVKTLTHFIVQHHAGRSELDTLAGLTAAQLVQIGDDYLRRIGDVAQAGAGAGPLAPHRRFVDKSLLNFIHVGLIHSALPNARFIHSRRAPIETCLSCYSKLFDDVPFSYDLGELGRYYRAYDALMDHWRAVLPPGVMLEVRYEELVTDFDAQARRMVQHCGFEWDDACSAFHKNQRAVATSSVAQVRRPLYRHALTRWRPAAQLLQPLLDGLGPALAGTTAVDPQDIHAGVVPPQ